MAPPEPSPTLLSRLRGGGPLVVLTGAGVSAESGLAMFRGPGGLWEGHDPASLATPEAFAAEPETVWRFYAWRREQAARAVPNAGHLALAAVERARPEVTLVTQNVDGLHERAGSRNVLLLHGTLWRLRCVAEQREFDDRRVDLGELPARCECGALLRPAVVWFGEPLREDVLAAALARARTADLVLVIGTSSLVYPAADLPRVARAAGAYVVEINPARTALSDAVDERLAGPSAQLVPRLLEAAGFCPELPA